MIIVTNYIFNHNHSGDDSDEGFYDIKNLLVEKASCVVQSAKRLHNGILLRLPIAEGRFAGQSCWVLRNDSIHDAGDIYKNAVMIIMTMITNGLSNNRLYCTKHEYLQL